MPGRGRRVARARASGARPLVAYVFPVVLGGGQGDLAELAAAAHAVSRAGIPLRLFRGGSRPMPSGTGSFAGRWHVIRRAKLRREADRAITLSCDFGVTAGRERRGAYGRPGPWAEEAAEIERAYGRGRVLHVSLGEFARTLTSREQVAERYREGGRSVNWIRRHLRSPGGRAEIAEAHRLFRRYRAFARRNLLHLFPTFADARTFRKEFPEAVMTGPIDYTPSRGAIRSRRDGSARWLWYASPSSSVRLLERVVGMANRLPRPLTIEVRSPRPVALPPPTARLRWRELPPLSERIWKQKFRRADLRIVTGSRSLLEALETVGPFLYFNGVLGRGRATRPHRPEKLRALLAASRRSGASSATVRAFSDFARLRGVERIVLRALDRRREGTGLELPRPSPPYPHPFGDGGELLRVVARRFADGENAVALVERVRRRALRPVRG